MESGLCKLINGSEANFEAALYYSDDNLANYSGSYPTWLDWIGWFSLGSPGGRTRVYTVGMEPLTFTYEKTQVTPAPVQYLIGASSGKLAMCVQAMHGTTFETGTASLLEFIADGGIVFGSGGA